MPIVLYFYSVMPRNRKRPLAAQSLHLEYEAPSTSSSLNSVSSSTIITDKSTDTNIDGLIKRFRDNLPPLSPSSPIGSLVSNGSSELSASPTLSSPVCQFDFDNNTIIISFLDVTIIIIVTYDRRRWFSFIVASYWFVRISRCYRRYRMSSSRYTQWFAENLSGSSVFF